MSKMVHLASRPWIARTLIVALGASLLFLHCVEGERATNGCPRDETCSDLTPDGLTFIGPTMFNDTKLVLGPVVEGGAYTLRIQQKNGSPVPRYAVESTNSAVFAAAIAGEPGPEGEQPKDIEITAKKAGASKLRVFDADTLGYFDGVEIDVRKVYAVAVRSVNGHEGLAYRGCPQMIGVELVVDRAGTKVRAFDEGVQLRVAGSAMPREPAIWDCFVHDVPANATTIDYEVIAGGKLWTATLATRDLADDQLSACPPISVD